MKDSSHVLCSYPKTLYFSQITDTSNDLLWMTPPSAHWYGPTLEKERQIGFLFVPVPIDCSGCLEPHVEVPVTLSMMD